MIEQVGIGQFQHAELLNFMIDEVKDARTIGASELTSTLDELDKVLKIFKAGLAKIIASAHSAKVAALDAIRDEAFRNLMGCIRGETFRPEADRREAAKRLEILLRAYKKLDRKSYRNETELMYKLTEELRSDKYKADVRKLAISVWIEKMDEANKAFDRIFDLRDNEEGARPITNNIEVRRQIEKFYERLLEIVGALQILKPSKAVDLFIGRHNERVDKMKALFALRQATGSKNIQTKRAILRNLASDLGWALPSGQSDYEFYGGTRILHPTERQWYCLGKKDGIVTLVEYRRPKKKTTPTAAEMGELPPLPSDPGGGSQGDGGEQGSHGGGL